MMDKSNWLKEILKLVNLAIQVYIESSSTLHNVENYIKKSAKYIIMLIIIIIPIVLTIWGGLFLALFFYITTHYGLSNYISAVIIAIINTLIFIMCLLWFKYKTQRNKLEKNNVSLLLMKLIRLANSKCDNI